jgi:hypothetical protein
VKTCFLIAPIGKPDSITRERTDKLEKHFLQPALRNLGYKLLRADKLPSPGIITNDIVRHLLDAELVIADITDRNENVFYEMGIRHAAKRPIIHVRHDNDSLPFDIVSMRTFDYSFDVSVRTSLIKTLKATIQSINDLVETPFSAATSSFLVIRGPGHKVPYRSLDIVQTADDLLLLIDELLSHADQGVDYWGQTVGGSTIAKGFGDKVQAAMRKGASFKFILNHSPPHSIAVAGELKKCQPDTKISFITATDCTTRLFGLGTSQLLIGARIDGVHNAFMIRDSDVIKFMYKWFNARFDDLQSQHLLTSTV